MHTHAYACTHTQIHTHARSAHAHMHTYTTIITYTYTHMHTCTHVNTHTRARAHTHTDTHTHTHTWTHTIMYMFIRVNGRPFWNEPWKGWGKKQRSRHALFSEALSLQSLQSLQREAETRNYAMGSLILFGAQLYHVPVRFVSNAQTSIAISGPGAARSLRQILLLLAT